MIEIGWWLVPFVGTIVAFFCAWYFTPRKLEKTEDLLNPIIMIALFAVATILSLGLWLIWAILV